MVRWLLPLLVVAALVAPTAEASADVTFACSPAPADCSGWYRQPVRVTWSVPPDYDTTGCDNKTYVTDTAGTQNRCHATNATTTVDVTVTIHLDQTPPVLLAPVISRPPDHDGWYTQPVEVRFAGTDPTSGLAGCTDVTYAGPDNAAAAIAGSCADRAGNVAPAPPFVLRYDATPPAVTLKARPGDHQATVRWQTSPDAVAVQVRRGHKLLRHRRAGKLTDHRVRNGHRYTYVVTAVDAAGNTTVRQLRVRPGRRLLRPRPGRHVSKPPLLMWTRVRGASYYNVQLFRHGHKVLSAWPKKPQLRLHDHWRFGGHSRRLRPGRYTWYVWPGHGPRAARLYGAPLGHRTFRVV